MIEYEEALDLYGIESGFVEDQLEELYITLKEKNDPSNFPFLSPEYKLVSDLRHQIVMAYSVLYSYHKNYILGKSLGNTPNNENLEWEVLRLIQDNVKGGKLIDEYFFASLVERIVCGLGLHDYVRRIKFEFYDKHCSASYDSHNNCLTIFLSSL